MSDSEVVDSVPHLKHAASMKCRNCGKPFKFNGPMNRDVQFLCQSKRCKLARKSWLQRTRREAIRVALNEKKGGVKVAPGKKRRSSGAARGQKSLAKASAGH